MASFSRDNLQFLPQQGNVQAKVTHNHPRWTFSELLSIYAEFLVVCTHTILYERGLYPEDSFALARKYNFPVRQSRHPAVCEWVRNAISACVEHMRTVSLNLCAIWC